VVTYISWSEKQLALNFYSRIVMESKEKICLECFTFILMDFKRYQLATISWQKKIRHMRNTGASVLWWRELPLNIL